MKNHHDKIIWAIILSETSHIFCCGLPIIFSILSLLTGFGIMAALPPQLVFIHDILHKYEPAMILFSASVLLLGWGFYFYAKHMEEKQHNHDCCAHHAQPEKTASKILIIATVLFVVNVSVYFGIHRHGAPIEIHDNHE